MSSRIKTLEQRIKDMLLDFDEIKELYGFVSELYGVDELKMDKVDSTVIRLSSSKPS